MDHLFKQSRGLGAWEVARKCVFHRSLLFQEASKIQHMESSAKLLCDTGEGNGTPLQYSCLENPMDGGAW